MNAVSICRDVAKDGETIGGVELVIDKTIVINEFYRSATMQTITDIQPVYFFLIGIIYYMATMIIRRPIEKLAKKKLISSPKEISIPKSKPTEKNEIGHLARDFAVPRKTAS